jgi:hypothetical protein
LVRRSEKLNGGKFRVFDRDTPGSRVNIEFDARTVAIIETVEHILEQRFEREQGRS